MSVRPKPQKTRVRSTRSLEAYELVRRCFSTHETSESLLALNPARGYLSVMRQNPLNALKKIAISLALPVIVFAQATPTYAARRTIEIGVDLSSGAVGTPLSSDELAAMAGVNGSFDLSFLFFRASVDASYQTVGAQSVYEIQASGGIAFAKLHELYVRSGGPNGSMSRVAAGAGGTFGLGSLGDLTLSAGIISLNWAAPGQEEDSLTGFYAGTQVFLKIWKFENELHVAYYAAPQLTEDLSQVVLNNADAIQQWRSGLIASNQLRFNAFKVSIFEFGPELRARVAELPNGTEWMATLGFGGRIGLF